MVWLKLLRFSKPAGRAVFIYFSFFLVRFSSSSFISDNASGTDEGGYSAVFALSPDVLSGVHWCLFWPAFPFRSANSTPLIAISRDLALYHKHT
jgi:hypothetical protein